MKGTTALRSIKAALSETTVAFRVPASLRATAPLPVLDENATAPLRAVSRDRRTAARFLRYGVLPAVIVAGMITAVITLSPGPATARQGVTGVSALRAGSAAGIGAGKASASGAVSLQVSDQKVRAANILAARTAAQALLDHRFHVAHLAHLTRLEQEASAAKAAAAAAAWAKSHPVPVASASSAVSSGPAPAGFYTEAMLGQLWLSEGGSAAAEGTAECIAEHESGGNPRAVSPTDDYGLWQINAGNASPSLMLEPAANAREAISLSDDGRNWSAWTTAPDCGVGASTTASVTPSGGITAFALEFRGDPYVYGGTSPSGFDCSGFAQYVYAHFGHSIPRTSEEQAAFLTATSHPSPGDLVFYWSGGDAYHVAIFLGGGQVISALNQSTGVVVTSLSWPGSDYSFGEL